jgi:AcrR family transcriptional regulator
MEQSTQKEARKQRKREIKRNLIISTAEQSFIEHGYDAAMIDQIALDAGYTKASIYNYFESKDDLFTGVLAKIYSQMFDTFQSFMNAHHSDIQLRMIGLAYLEFLKQYPGQAELIDSGRCVTINRVMLEKEALGQTLTKSEVEFRTNEEQVGELVQQVIIRSLSVTSNIELTPTEEQSLRVTKIFGAFMPVIRELVRRGDKAGQTPDEIEGTLSVLFTILEQGVKHYDD